MWHELTATTDFTQALDFHGELFDWEIHTVAGAGDGCEYAPAEEEGTAFAGFGNARGQVPAAVAFTATGNKFELAIAVSTPPRSRLPAPLDLPVLVALVYFMLWLRPKAYAKV